jgi:hypothetical protein
VLCPRPLWGGLGCCCAPRAREREGCLSQGRPHAVADPHQTQNRQTQLLSEHLARWIRRPKPKLNVTERVGRATEAVPTPRGAKGALAESRPPDDRMAHAQYSSTYGRPITYLMGGSLVEVHSSSYFCFCLSHARTVFSCGAPCCNPAHRDGMGSGG